MADYTEGPWDYFVGNSNGRGLIRIEARHDSPVAGKHVASMPRGAESEGNARLIAAAFELFQAGTLMVNDYQTSEQHHPNYVLVPLAAFKALQSAVAVASPPSGGVEP